MKSIIEANEIVYEYFRRDEEGSVIGETRALDGISLKVKEGDFIAVLGANGSGKSTFAKHINALLTPTEGTIYIDSKDSKKQDNILEIRRKAGMVFQNPDNQIIANVVEEDVGFGPENLGVPTEQIWKRVEESLKSVGMYAYRKHSPNKLSGGQKQRVAIAGILAMKPKCIVLDEPTAMLDPAGRKNVMEAITRINKEEKITIILITHFMEEVTEADYVYVMNQGQIALEGTPREIFAKGEQLEEYRITVPEVTKLAIALRKKGVPVTAELLNEQELAEALLEVKREKRKIREERDVH